MNWLWRILDRFMSNANAPHYNQDGLAVTVANGQYFEPGMSIRISGTAPSLPRWVTKWPWQDGDQAIVKWFYRIVGWKLPTLDAVYVVKSATYTVLTLIPKEN